MTDEPSLRRLQGVVDQLDVLETRWINLKNDSLGPVLSGLRPSAGGLTLRGIAERVFDDIGTMSDFLHGKLRRDRAAARQATVLTDAKIQDEVDNSGWSAEPDFESGDVVVHEIHPDSEVGQQHSVIARDRAGRRDARQQSAAHLPGDANLEDDVVGL